MVDFKIATSAEQPINRDGAVSKIEMADEGELVGMDNEGELVAADAANGVPAVGVSMAPVLDEATTDAWPSSVAAQVMSQRRLVGEHKITFVHYGVEVVDEDGEGSLTPGQPVYLAEGGGYTQTEPSTTDSIVQQLGIASADGDTILLDVAWNYSTVA